MINSQLWPNCALGYLVSFSSGDGITSKSIEPVGKYPVWGANGLRGFTSSANLKEDALLIGRVGALCGNIHIATAPSFVSEHALIGRIVANCEIRWLYYLATHLDLRQYAQGTAQPVISAERIRRLEIPLPPHPTQRAIADYLDRETAEIDAMAAELDELVERLAERRVSKVNSLVNRDGNGEVNLRLRLALETHFTGIWGSDPGQDEVDVPCVRVADFDRHSRSVTDDVPTRRSIPAKKLEEKRLQYGDLLIERSGGGDKNPVGTAVLYLGRGDAICANFIEVARLRDNHDPRFWRDHLYSAYATRNTAVHVRQTTGIQNLVSRF